MSIFSIYHAVLGVSNFDHTNKAALVSQIKFSDPSAFNSIWVYLKMIQNGLYALQAAILTTHPVVISFFSTGQREEKGVHAVAIAAWPQTWEPHGAPKDVHHFLLHNCCMFGWLLQQKRQPFWLILFSHKYWIHFSSHVYVGSLESPAGVSYPPQWLVEVYWWLLHSPGHRTALRRNRW